MNLGHLKSLPGILKIVGIVVGIITGGLAANAFVKSEYNKSCRNSEVFPPEGNLPPPSTLNPGDGSSTPSTLRTRPTATPPSVFQVKEATTEDPEAKDVAPVLWMERFHISITFICVIVSIILLLVFIFVDDMDFNKVYKAINFGFHFIGCVLLIVSAIFMAFSAIEIDKRICQGYSDNREDCQAYKQKMAAAASAFLLSVIYGVLSFTVIRKKLYEQVYGV